MSESSALLDSASIDDEAAAVIDTQIEQNGGFCGCCKWFTRGNCCVKKKLIFIGWILIALLAPAFYAIYLNATDTTINYGFILCCSLAVLMSIYATYNFRDVISLDRAINILVDSTIELAEKRDNVRNEVGKLQTAHAKLEGIEEKLSESNNALRKHFKELEQWHTTIADEIAENPEISAVINKDFRSAIQQYKKLLVHNERAILEKAYRHIEGKDGQKGLSKDEFDDLLYSLPARYKLKFEQSNKTFEYFAGDDHIIDYGEFQQFMHEMADEEALCGVDIPQYGISLKRKKKKIIYDDDGKDDEKGN